MTVLTVVGFSLGWATPTRAQSIPSPGSHDADADAEQATSPLGSLEIRRSSAPFEGLSSRARCTGPDGSAFLTEIVSLADGTARFLQVHPDGRSEILVMDGSAYTRPVGSPSGEGMEPAANALEAFVRGHELHRMLLELERRFEVMDSSPSSSDGDDCLELRDRDGLPAQLCLDEARSLPSALALTIPEEIGGGTVQIDFEDWRRVHGVQLPFRARFHHGDELFHYEFFEILPFRISPSTTLPREPSLLWARLGDFADIVAVHERALLAHRKQDVGTLLADETGEGLISGRGRLSVTTREEMKSRLGPYLEATRFGTYTDQEVPMVAVSHDGTLGWLGCEIEARGEQTGPGGERLPVEFGFSWVELLVREGEEWKRAGNASSSRP